MLLLLSSFLKTIFVVEKLWNYNILDLIVVDEIDKNCWKCNHKAVKATNVTQKHEWIVNLPLHDIEISVHKDWDLSSSVGIS